MIIFKLLLITVICVIIIDLSGFPESIKSFLGKLLSVQWYQIKLKPFDCSFCMNFWISLFYLIVNNYFCLEYLTLTLFYSAMTPVLKNFILKFQDILLKLIN